MNGRLTDNPKTSFLHIYKHLVYKRGKNAGTIRDSNLGILNSGISVFKSYIPFYIHNIHFSVSWAIYNLCPIFNKKR